MYECPLCPKSFQTSAHLNAHLVTHTKEKPHKCPNCSAAFGLAANLKIHIKSVHDGIKEIKKRNTHCPLCSYKCHSKTHLQVHLRKHSLERPFCCGMPGCGFKTKYKTTLVMHCRVVHCDEQPFECPSDGCKYKGKTKYHLRCHLKSHNNLKPFQCSTCGFRTKYSSNLKQHELTHMTTKRFQCPAPNCGFASHRKNQVDQHFDTKHRKKYVRCTEPGCNYRYGSIPLLQNHLKKKGKRNHVCTFCFSRFIHLSALQRHIQRHTGEKPYNCSYCDETTVTSSELRRHAGKVHRIHVIPRGKEEEKRDCHTCNMTLSSYTEFVLHSMTHLRPMVVLERLRVRVD